MPLLLSQLTPLPSAVSLHYQKKKLFAPFYSDQNSKSAPRDHRSCFSDQNSKSPPRDHRSCPWEAPRKKARRIAANNLDHAHYQEKHKKTGDKNCLLFFFMRDMSKPGGAYMMPVVIRAHDGLYLEPHYPQKYLRTIFGSGYTIFPRDSR